MATTAARELNQLVHQYLAAWDGGVPDAVTEVFGSDVVFPRVYLTGFERESSWRGGTGSSVRVRTPSPTCATMPSSVPPDQ